MNNTNSTQRENISRTSFGKMHEYIVIAELLRQGCNVYIPVADDQQIDCVIRRGDHDYIDLQIKSKSKKCKIGNAGIFAPLKILNPRDKYFFLFYCEHIDTYWIFPSKDLVKKAKKTTTETKTGEKKVTYTINMTREKKGEVYAKEEYSEYIVELDNIADIRLRLTDKA